VVSLLIALTKPTSNEANSRFVGIKSTPSLWCKTASSELISISFIHLFINVESVTGKLSALCHPI
jgi:hypothetical protein